jgi:hypothetical protein
MRKLKQSEVKAYRENMLKEQGGKCAFCGQDCKKPCLDHSHRGPNKDKIRGVLCNHCNVLIGKVENSALRLGIGFDELVHCFPHVAGYSFGYYEKNDWHPSKRKSELTEFRKLKAQDQTKVLSDMEHALGIKIAFVPRNEKQRIHLFRKLNNKT